MTAPEDALNEFADCLTEAWAEIDALRRTLQTRVLVGPDTVQVARRVALWIQCGSNELPDFSDLRMIANEVLRVAEALRPDYEVA